jgi:hypothetical protein
VEKAAKIFCGNMKVLLFEDEEYKEPTLKITTLVKIWGALYKKIRLKIDYDKVQGLIWKR